MDGRSELFLHVADAVLELVSDSTSTFLSWCVQQDRIRYVIISSEQKRTTGGLLTKSFSGRHVVAVELTRESR